MGLVLGVSVRLRVRVRVRIRVRVGLWFVIWVRVKDRKPLFAIAPLKLHVSPEVD